MAWQSSTINPATTTPAADISKITNDLQQLRSVVGGGTDGDIPAAWATPANVLAQTANSGTTGGTSTAYTLTPATAITSYAAGQTFWVNFHTASGASPTLQVSGVASPPSLVKQTSAGTYTNIAASEIPANHRSRVTLLSATQALVEDLPPATGVARSPLQPITASVGSNALTVSLAATTLDFRSSTLGSGTVNTRTVASTISVVVPSTATLGTTNGVASRLLVLAIDNAGTVELAVVNAVGGGNLDESGLISTTAISTSATSASVIYSTTARTSVPYRIVGYVESTQATAGTWATAPSVIQGAGGKERAASLIVQGTAVASTSGTAIDFTGIPSWARRVTVMFNGVSSNGISNMIVQLGAGSVTTTGYTGAVVATDGTISGSSGIAVAGSFAAATWVAHGHVTIDLIASNTWVATVASGRTDAAVAAVGSVAVALSGALDRVRITTAGGVNTFDAGTINILYE